MNPGWFYRDNYLGKTSKGRGISKNNTILKGNMEFFNGKYNMYFMNNVTPPNDAEIHALQMINLKKNFVVDNEVRKYVDDYNNDTLNISTNKFDLNKMIQIIEDVFQKKIPEFDKVGEGNILLSQGIPVNPTQAQLVKYQEILDELRYIHDFFSSYIINAGIPSINQDEFVSKMKRIENAANRLEADLNNGTYSGAYFDIPPLSKAKTISNYVQGLGYILKSRLVEIQSTNFVNKIPNLIGLDTSKIRGASFTIFGDVKNEGKMLRTDTLAFSKDDLNNIKVTYTINGISHTCSLADFFKVVETASKNHESILISEKSQEELFNSAKFGIQSKSGFNQSPFNNFKITPAEAVGIGERSTATDVLMYFILWHNDMHHTKANHKIYNAYFNLCISHDLTYIIGFKNSLIATRNGIYPLVDYMEEQWRTAGKIIKAKNLISVGSYGEIPVDVNLSSAKI